MTKNFIWCFALVCAPLPTFKFIQVQLATAICATRAELRAPICGGKHANQWHSMGMIKKTYSVE